MNYTTRGVLTAPPFTGRPVAHDRQTTTPTKTRRQQRADRPARIPIAFADQRQPQTKAAEIATATGRQKTAAMKRRVAPATIGRVFASFVDGGRRAQAACDKITADARQEELIELVSKMPADRQAKFLQWLRLTVDLINDVKPIDLAAARRKRKQ